MLPPCAASMVAAAAMLLAACGRVGFDSALGDGHSDGEPGTDVLDLASGPWSVPMPITTLNSTENEEEATFTADRLELIYRAGPTTNLDLFVSRRASPTDPWGPRTPISELNTTDVEITPSISRDGLTLYFSSNRPPSNGDDVWVTTRATRTSPWDPPTRLAAIDTGDNETGPFADASGLYYNQQTATDAEIVHTADPSTPGVPITELTSAGRDGTLRAWAGGLRIVWATSRTSSTQDIWEASRASLADPFTNLAEVPGINMPGCDDWDMWISEDGHYAVFGSDRAGDHDLYEVFR